MLPFVIEATVQLPRAHPARVHQAAAARRALHALLVIERVHHAHDVAIGDGRAAGAAAQRDRTRCGRRQRPRRQSAAWRLLLSGAAGLVMEMRRVRMRE